MTVCSGIALLALVLGPAATVFAEKTLPCTRPLSEQDVLELVKGGVSTTRLDEIVVACGIRFALSPAVELRLRAAGADVCLLLSLRSVRYRSPGATETPGRRVKEADLQVAAGVCQEATDSCSLARAMDILNGLVGSGGSSTEVQATRDDCARVYEKAKAADRVLAEAIKDFERDAFADARDSFEKLASQASPHSAEARSYLSRLTESSLAGNRPGQERDWGRLQMAARHFKANNPLRARALLETLLDSPSVAPQAKALLGRLENRGKCQAQVAEAVGAIDEKRCADGLALLEAVQRDDPDYPGIASLIGLSAGCTPARKSHSRP